MVDVHGESHILRIIVRGIAEDQTKENRSKHQDRQTAPVMDYFL